MNNQKGIESTVEYKLATNTGNIIASLNLQIAQLQKQIDDIYNEKIDVEEKLKEANKKLARYDEKGLIRGGDSEANRTDTDNR